MFAMPSPFPGMDPYLEAPGIWTDFSHNFCDELRTAVVEILRPGHYAQIDQRLWVPDDPDPPRRIRIVDRTSRKVVTVVEILGSSNRESIRLTAPPEGLKCNLMRLDLLRRQSRTLPGSSSPEGEYVVTLQRTSRPHQVELWPVRLQDPFPTVPLPTDGQALDSLLRLQPILERVYDRGGYDLEIDYRKEPVPELPPDLARWADELLRAKDLR